jgi:hypothetical protein
LLKLVLGMDNAIRIGWVVFTLALGGCSSEPGDGGGASQGGSSAASGAAGVGGASGASNAVGGASGASSSALNGVFTETERGESDDCTSDPALVEWSLGDTYRFAIEQGASGERLVEYTCRAAGCSTSPSRTFSQQAGVWTAGGANFWSAMPPCEYMTARFTLTALPDGSLRKKQETLTAPLEAAGATCPRTVVQNTTCSHVFVYRLTSN